MASADTLKIVLGIPVILIMVLSALARKRPAVRWLQAFNLQAGLTDEQRARLRRTQNGTAGAQLILLGIAIPMGYLALKVMFFTEVQPGELVIVGFLCSVCIALGIVALVRNR